MAGADLSSGFSATVASVVSSNPATDEAFCSAVRTTLVGSTIPALMRSSKSPLAALKPLAPRPPRTLSSTMEPSSPALVAIQRSGSCTARRMMLTPTCSSSLTLTAPSVFADARIRATPPPGTIPSSTAARVACSASSTRAFFSFISISVAAPTWMTATPPIILARRSCSFSRS